MIELEYHRALIVEAIATAMIKVTGVLKKYIIGESNAYLYLV